MRAKEPIVEYLLSNQAIVDNRIINTLFAQRESGTDILRIVYGIILMSLTDGEKSLVEDIVIDVDGVGKKTAERIATVGDEIENYNNLTMREINSVVNDKQRSRGVIQELRRVDFSRDIDEIRVEEQIYDFVSGQYEGIQETTIDDIEEKINILMKDALDLSTEELMRFYMYQTVERSASTSWGMSVEKMCKIAGAEEVPDSEQINLKGKSFDIKKETDKNTYYIQVKAGPNTMNVGMVNSLNDAIELIEEKNERSVGVLGMTYGNPDIVSNQIRGNLNNYERKAYVGEEFWELVSGEKNYMDFLVTTINNVNNELSEEFGGDYSELLEQKINELSGKWSARYE